jgi:3-hydroxyisobutyrate dehydrogenase
MKIAFIGLGAMGRPMAGNLLKAGHEVQGFDLYPPSLEDLVKRGGKAFSSAKAACTGCDGLILMVVNGEQAEDALFNQGALAALNPQATVILCATCAPAKVEAIAARVAATQRKFIDCPVSGGVVGAENGTLTMMVAAPAAHLAPLKEIITTMGSRFYHVGENAGQGATVKVINQLLSGVHIAAAAEALTLGAKSGLDGTQLIEIFGGSAASSWMLTNRGPRMLEETPIVTSAVDIFVKDMGLVMGAAKGVKAELLLAALTEQLFIKASSAGLGKADDSQVIRVI